MVEDDGSINTTMVHSTMARTAFMKGDKFPADDKVCIIFISCLLELCDISHVELPKAL